MNSSRPTSSETENEFGDVIREPWYALALAVLKGLTVHESLHRMGLLRRCVWTQETIEKKALELDITRMPYILKYVCGVSNDEIREWFGDDARKIIARCYQAKIKFKGRKRTPK